VRQGISCMACTSSHMLSHFSNSTATNKTRKKRKSMRPPQVLARCFVLDFDSLAEDLVAGLRNRRIELDLLDQYISLTTLSELTGRVPSGKSRSVLKDITKRPSNSGFIQVLLISLSLTIQRDTDRGDLVIWADDVEIPIIKDLFEHVIDSLFGCPWGVGLVFTARSPG
jgi:hypothetical protein